ncbi:hypothetical protein J3R30DRAFT_3294275 [Lentinula aciculospora]|uniref:MYND-type domain-containing protein n=1 Tax=Lentinula aciculospora TaxID=153920 RepID=A0A9W9A7N2_9AGAR|nr:hypothetical protein J3R30DRAFT_3294275 [Lentinula aciculospora]
MPLLEVCTLTGLEFFLTNPTLSLNILSKLLLSSPYSALFFRDDPFPEQNLTNHNPIFCMKTYTENEGILPQLINLGIIQQVGQLNNGPLVEALLGDRQISHACLYFSLQNGLPESNSENPGDECLIRCSRCKQTFYCNTKCQQADWVTHKGMYKTWRDDPSEVMRSKENERRTVYIRAINNSIHI